MAKKLYNQAKNVSTLVGRFSTNVTTVMITIVMVVLFVYGANMSWQSVTTTNKNKYLYENNDDLMQGLFVMAVATVIAYFAWQWKGVVNKSNDVAALSGLYTAGSMLLL
jgi:uncharacterized membrane protein YidH (DUF202 family)